MAKYQYRISGEFEWIASSGNAAFALVNLLGSGKRLTIRSLEVTPLASLTVATRINQLSLVRGAAAMVTAGESLPLVKLDTAAAALPSGVSVLRGSMISGTVETIGRQTAHKSINPATALAWKGWSSMNVPGGRFSGSQLRARKRSGPAGDVERVVVRPGEAVAVYAPVSECSIPLRINAMLKVQGSPARSWMASGFVNLLCPGMAVLAVVNNSAADIVELVEWGVLEVGTYDSPYFQVVPIATVEAAAFDDPLNVLPVLKMDTAYPDTSSWFRCVRDVPLNPFGVPQEYCSQGGLASPKGFNYLGAKDFVGPVWRAFFPEMTGAAAPGVKSDNLLLNSTHRGADLLMRRAGIVLREGEGMALASAAETAVATTSVGVSGWGSFHFAAHIDVEPTVTPNLTVSAQVSLAGAEVRIYDMDNNPAGSLGTELSGIESCPTATYSYTGDIGNTIWLQIFKPGYREFGQAITLPAVQEYGYSITLQPDLNA
jgi:hypothetical protein